MICRVCSSDYVDHHLTVECDDCRWKTCKNTDCSNRLKKSDSTRSYCSHACRISYPLAKHRDPAVLVRYTCPCGKSFLRVSGKVYCSKECREKYTKSVSPWKGNSDRAREAGRKPKPNHGLRGYKQTEEHLLKRLGTGAIRSSKEELSLVPALAKMGYRHTGEGAFWRRWKDGTLHNPDFVCEETRTVVEYFGAYWHADDRGREDEICQRWAEIGWECIIFWPEDRERLLADYGSLAQTR